MGDTKPSASEYLNREGEIPVSKLCFTQCYVPLRPASLVELEFVRNGELAGSMEEERYKREGIIWSEVFLLEMFTLYY